MDALRWVLLRLRQYWLFRWPVRPARAPVDAQRSGVMALLVGGVGYGGGVVALWQCSDLPSSQVLAVAAGCGMLAAAGMGWMLLGRGAQDRSVLTRGVLWCGFAAAIALVAWAVTAARCADRLQQRLPPAWDDRLLWVQAVVEELPVRTARGTSVLMRIEQLEDQPLPLALPPWSAVGARVRLSWSVDPRAVDGLGAPSPVWVPGQRWRLPVRLRSPPGQANPAGFDPAWWALEHSVAAVGQVPAALQVQAQRLSEVPGSVLWPQRWRALLRQRIDAHLENTRWAGLVAGLTVGDQSGVSPSDWALFRDTGVAHTLAISGLHITAFAALTAPLAAAVWRRSATACAWVPAGTAGRLCGLGSAFLFALLAGWGLPAQRTIAMLATALGVQAAGWSWPLPLVWWVAGLAVWLPDPWALASPSFWLSFVAVGLLLLGPQRTGAPVDASTTGASTVASAGAAVPRVRRLCTGAWASVGQQWRISLGLAPLAAVCFHQLSVVGVAANLVVVPWMTFVLTPWALLGLIWPALWQGLPLAAEPMMALLQWLQSLPWAQLSVPAAPVWAQALALLGACLGLCPVPRPLALAGWGLTLPLLCGLASAPPPPQGRFLAVALDVGQGSAVVVRTHSRTLLVDTGPRWGEDGEDAGATVLLPFLRAWGVRQIDGLVLSHADLDHVGGAASVLGAQRVAMLLSSLDAGHALVRRARTAIPCRAGQAWHWDGVRVEVHHPSPEEAVSRQPNRRSCVLHLVDAQGHTLVLPGDAGVEEEAAMLVRYGGGRQTAGDTAVLVPHHGSRSSSSVPWVQALAPRWAHAQAGRRNPYGHPVPEVLDRYRAVGARVTVSPTCGAWLWASGQEPWCWMHQQQRFWHPSVQRPSSTSDGSAPGPRHAPTQ